MSTEEQVDPRLVEQAQQQIRGLVDEIVALARKDLTVEQFYTEYLGKVVQALAAVGGAVWKAGEGGGPEVQAQLNFQEGRLGATQEDLIRHRRLIQHSFRSGEASLVQPHSGGADENGVNPSDYLLVLGPVKVGDETQHVVEIFQRPNPSTRTQRGYLRFLSQMCEVAANYLKNRQLQSFTDRQSLWSQLEQFTRAAHVSLEPSEVAYTIANEGRRLIQCDRVSVAIRQGNKCVIKAISGQDTFDARSNTVVLLSQLATAVVRAGEPVWYAGETKDMAPEIEQAVEGYVDESHTKQLAVIPLSRPLSPTADKDARIQRPVGALIVEQIEDTRARDGFLQRVNVVSEHSATALANATEYHELFLMPVWRTIGKSRVLVEARNLPKTILGLCVAAVLVLALTFVPYQFNIHSPGRLQPIQRREVFAKVDGILPTRIPETTAHGKEVKAGQLLLQLDNSDLMNQRQELVGKFEASRASWTSIRQQLTENRKLTEQEKNRLVGQLAELEETMRSVESQLLIINDKITRTEVVSPIDGEITTWDVDVLLRGRPVRTGQVLLNVANAKGPWELELQMPEDRMGYLSIARADIRPDLDVTFHLATDPSRQYKGKIREVHLTAEVHGEEGNTVLVKVEIDQKHLPQPLRPGADVSAKVHCGHRALGFVMFHDLINWFRKNVLFKVF